MHKTVFCSDNYFPHIFWRALDHELRNALRNGPLVLAAWRLAADEEDISLGWYQTAWRIASTRPLARTGSLGRSSFPLPCDGLQTEFKHKRAAAATITKSGEVPPEARTGMADLGDEGRYDIDVTLTDPVGVHPTLLIEGYRGDMRHELQEEDEQHQGEAHHPHHAA